MTILLFSALLLLIILLINYFVGSKRKGGMKILVVFGIIIGLLALGLNSLFNDAFGASTPVNLRTENLTDKNLNIYSIIFWDNSWSGKGNYVYYDTELKPNEKSEDFWFENDGTTEFWLVAKDENNEIEYLKVITERKSEIDIEITEDKNIDPNKIQTAQQLIFNKDKSQQMEKYTVWANIILIGLLIGSLVVRKNYWQHR